MSRIKWLAVIILLLVVSNVSLAQTYYIDDWTIETYNTTIGPCPTGYSSQLYIGATVAPVASMADYPGVELFPLPSYNPLNGVDVLGRSVGQWQYAVVIGDIVCNQETVWREVALDVGGSFRYGWMPEYSLTQGQILINNPNMVAPTNFAASIPAAWPDLSQLDYPAGYAIMFENADLELSGVAVRSLPGYPECQRGVQILTRVNITDGTFRILNRDLTGTWLQIRLQNETVGWVATRLVHTNLSNPAIFEQLPLINQRSICPSITA